MTYFLVDPISTGLNWLAQFERQYKASTNTDMFADVNSMLDRFSIIFYECFCTKFKFFSNKLDKSYN
jgi:hypothetical protein